MTDALAVARSRSDAAGADDALTRPEAIDPVHARSWSPLLRRAHIEDTADALACRRRR
jgi:hypothetical protein